MSFREKKEEPEDPEKIFGTEKDKVNCPFWLKIGACRHGDICSRVHIRPAVSQTMIVKNMYVNAATHISKVDDMSLEDDDEESQKHLEEFYEDIYGEFSKFGKIDELNVSGNLGDHLLGNVYVKYATPDECAAAFQAFRGRYYAGRPLFIEYSPVTNFHEARCRQYDQGECSRGSYCNFMHLKKISRELWKKFYPQRRFNHSTNPKEKERDKDKDFKKRDSPEKRGDRDDRRRKRERSPSPSAHHRRDQDRGDRNRDRSPRRDRHRSPHYRRDRSRSHSKSRSRSPPRRRRDERSNSPRKRRSSPSRASPPRDSKSSNIQPSQKPTNDQSTTATKDDLDLLYEQFKNEVGK